jgi:hypothetical protein
LRVNVGGDPERDDYGLPPVDVVIPDDARELDRDVQAYQRELRALRRRQRASRLRRPLTRDGMVLPLLAGCLILALITSTLLIMFAADQTGMPDMPGRATTTTPVTHRPTAVRTQPAAGQIDGPLPAAVVVIGHSQEQLSAITATEPSVLALVPLSCRCLSALRQLRAQAARANVTLYLVGTGVDFGQVTRLAAQAGQNLARVADDVSNVLGKTYHELGLTAILVRPGGSVAYVAWDILLSQPSLETRLLRLDAAAR